MLTALVQQLSYQKCPFPAGECVKQGCSHREAIQPALDFELPIYVQKINSTAILIPRKKTPQHAVPICSNTFGRSSGGISTRFT